MKKFLFTALLALLVLLAFSCSANKTTPAPAVAGGTSEETNALARNEVLSVIGRDGQSKTALAFNPSSYLASEYGGKFAQVRSFEISAWLKIDSLPEKSAMPHNLIGKFNAKDAALPSEFSLSLLNGACGTEVPTFAFFLTDENSAFDCKQAVLSKEPVKAGSWILVKAKWDGRYLTLFQDGVTVAREEKISPVLPYSRLPVYLGKSQISFAIDGLSLNTEAL